MNLPSESSRPCYAPEVLAQTLMKIDTFINGKHFTDALGMRMLTFLEKSKFVVVNRPDSIPSSWTVHVTASGYEALIQYDRFGFRL